MLDRTAIAVAPSRVALVIGLFVIGLGVLVPIARAPAPVPRPCPAHVSEDHGRASIPTRTRELNPRYFSRSRFGDPMLAR